MIKPRKDVRQVFNTERGLDADYAQRLEASTERKRLTHQGYWEERKKVTLPRVLWLERPMPTAMKD